MEKRKCSLPTKFVSNIFFIMNNTHYVKYIKTITYTVIFPSFHVVTANKAIIQF